jgi:hypothetical protein
MQETPKRNAHNRGFGRNPIKSQSREVEFVNEGIDGPNWIVLIDPVPRVFRKQRRLLAINSLNEAPRAPR